MGHWGTKGVSQVQKWRGKPGCREGFSAMGGGGGVQVLWGNGQVLWGSGGWAAGVQGGVWWVGRWGTKGWSGA